MEIIGFIFGIAWYAVGFWGLLIARRHKEQQIEHFGKGIGGHGLPDTGRNGKVGDL